MTDSTNTRIMSRRNFTKNVAASLLLPATGVVASVSSGGLADLAALYHKVFAEFERAIRDADVLGEPTPEVLAAAERRDALSDSIDEIAEAMAEVPARGLPDLALKAGILPKRIMLSGLSDAEELVLESLLEDIAALSATA